MPVEQNKYKRKTADKQAQPAHWARFCERAGDYQALLCDIWGVIHNGVAIYAAAIEALARFRQAHGRVVLLSNAPRPSAVIGRQLEALGVDRQSFDAILTSGDLTREAVMAGRYGDTCYHLGPPRDLGLFDNAKLRAREIEDADFILCSGFEDDQRQTPEDYRALLTPAAAAGKPLICANPDRLVERGGRLIPCAGQIADFYETLGGRAIYFGKPYPPIYEKAAALLGQTAPQRTLAIGDGLETDIKGAAAQGLATLLITSGVAAEIGDDHSAIQAACHKIGIIPNAWMKRLVW